MARAPVILIVSEHEWASRSLDTILAPRGYTVERAYNAAQALERTRVLGPDAVFIEHSLPDLGGPELCRRLRQEGALTAATPMILTTSGPVTQEQRVEALRSGAWELVTLPMDAEELVLRLRRYTRAKLEVDRAAESTRTDPETGFYNETGILQRTHELVAAAERHGRPLACVVFEPTADSDEAVRELLSEIVRVLRKSTRRSDVIGRIGPAQFAIVAPDTEPQGAEILADRLRQGVKSPAATLGARAGVFGVADTRTTRIDPEELFRRAVSATRRNGPPESPELN